LLNLLKIKLLQLNYEDITLDEFIGCTKQKKSCQKNLYKKTYTTLMASSYSLCNKDKQLAEDLLHDAYIKIFKYIHQVKLEEFQPNRLYAWCKRILTNVIYDYYRNNKNKKTIYIDEFNLDISLESEKSESDYCEYKQLNYKDVVSSMEALSPQYKLVFQMYLIDGYSHKEISKKLGIGEGTSKSNLHKSKAKVKQELSNMLKVNL